MWSVVTLDEEVNAKVLAVSLALTSHVVRFSLGARCGYALLDKGYSYSGVYGGKIRPCKFSRS